MCATPHQAAGSSLLAAFLILSAPRAAWACESDQQCKGDRVCQEGNCVDPKPKAKAKRKKESEQSTSSGPWDSAKGIIGATPWMSAAVLIGKHFPGADDRRVPDRGPHMGFGIGVQVALAHDGFVVGLRYHYVPEQEWTGTTSGTTDERVPMTVRESNSLYLLETGADVRLSSSVVMRLLGGLGMTTGTRRYPATGFGSNEPRSERELVGSLGAQLLYRPHASMYIGPHLGSLIRLKGSGIQTFDLFAVLGAVL